MEVVATGALRKSKNCPPSSIHSKDAHILQARNKTTRPESNGFEQQEAIRQQLYYGELKHLLYPKPGSTTLKGINRARLATLASTLLAATLTTPQAHAQSKAVIHKDTHWQARSACQIRSPFYTGDCTLTVISFGKSMNIHFDIDNLGSQGISFAGNDFMTTSHGAVLEVLGVTGRFAGEDKQEFVPGECNVDFAEIYDPRKKGKSPWRKTGRIICVSEDGRFNAIAE